MFESIHETLSERIHRHALLKNGSPIAYGDVLNLWQRDRRFCSFFNSLLRECRFPAFRWETPALRSSTVSRAFEFVLLDSPELSRSPDRSTYADHFTDEDIVSFENLGNDAVLVVPTPGDPDADYAHLAAFLGSAPESQTDALWPAVGKAAQRAMNEREIWVNTAGGGVAWLHVRIDSRPKYYGYAPYKKSGSQT